MGWQVNSVVAPSKKERTHRHRTNNSKNTIKIKTSAKQPQSGMALYYQETKRNYISAHSIPIGQFETSFASERNACAH